MLKEMQRQYLISHKEETFLCCKSDYILNALSTLNLTCERGGGSLERFGMVNRQAVMSICCHLVAL